MIYHFERAYLMRCAARAVNRIPAKSRAAEMLSSWAEQADLGFTWDPEHDHGIRVGLAKPAWNELRDLLGSEADKAGQVRPDALAQNVSALATHVGLNAVETEIFGLALRAKRSGPLHRLCDTLTDDLSIPIDDAVACLTGLPGAEVQSALRPSARLIATGLLQRDTGHIRGLGLEPVARLVRALEMQVRGLDEILAQLFSTPGEANVDWNDFEHLGAARDFAGRLLRGALAGRERGINLLFHGAPGTGKTAFCKVLAHQLGARLHSVGEADDDGNEPRRTERLQHLCLGQRLLAGQGQTLLLFDEMEDLTGWTAPFMGMGPFSPNSKAHLNRLLEDNAVPTLWTSNDISACDPAFLRRMTFVQEVRPPAEAARRRIWRRLSDLHAMPLPVETSDTMARESTAAPALIGTALRAARIAGGDASDVPLALDAIERATAGASLRARTLGAEVPFDPALAYADTDLATLTDRVVAAGASSFSLCLSGPPGTGKSAFARHLAARLNLPVLEKRASELLDRFVGGTEQAIAAAFAEARDTGAFLIFDEVDSLLDNRAGARARWELSQVNEMLTWLEHHPLPLACTTNMIERLDPAARRRFTLQVAFLPLDVKGRHDAFSRFFGLPAPRALDALDLLTPGDFALVARRARLLGLTGPDAFLAELQREQSAKPGARAPVGFRAA